MTTDYATRSVYMRLYHSRQRNDEPAYPAHLVDPDIVATLVQQGHVEPVAHGYRITDAAATTSTQIDAAPEDLVQALAVAAAHSPQAQAAPPDQRDAIIRELRAAGLTMLEALVRERVPEAEHFFRALRLADEHLIDRD